MRNAYCTACPLHAKATTICIDGDGPANARILFIGEAPGDREDKLGRPFVGQSGQLVRAEVSKAGLGEVRYTNTVRCRPPGNRQPTKDEIKACRPYLDAELAEVKPEYVVTLGNVSSKAVLKHSKITQDHGKIVKMPGYIGMPMYHPAYILRDPSKLPDLQRDLRRLKAEIDGMRKVEDIEWSFLTRKNFDIFINQFTAAEEFSFDTETTGLFMHRPGGKVRTLQIAMPGRVWVIRFNMLDSVMPKHATQYKFMNELARIARGKWVYAQNGKFDNLWLMTQYGARFKIELNTQLAHHLLNENEPHDLKTMARTYCDAPDYDLPLQHLLFPEKHGKLDEFYDYAARDAYYTLKLGQRFRAQLQKDRVLRKIFYSLVMPAARAFEDIEARGITLDIPKFEETAVTTKFKMLEAERVLNEMAAKQGGHDINWNSPAQVAKFLYETLKIKATVFTDGGAPSTGEEALYEIRDQHPIANQLVTFRELAKFHSTYLEGWRELIVEDRIYFSTKIHGTVTGRYSSRLHQVPRDGTIRNLAIAPAEYTFVQADLSQAELRTVAEVSQDPELIKCFRLGIDVHWRTLLFTILSGGSGEYYEPALETASKIAKRTITDLEQACDILLKAGHEVVIAIWKAWKEGRKKAKGINFGFVYGMMEKKFIEYAKLKYGFEPTMREAENLREAYFSLYRRLDAWHRKQRALVRLDGEVRNLIGRVRRLPGIYSKDRSLSSEAERQAINSPIQGFIGDLKAMALVEIHQTFTPHQVRIVGEVHDALLLNVRTDELDEHLPRIRAIMRHPKLLDEFGVNLSVPLEADLELGPWGAGKTYTKDKQ